MHIKRVRKIIESCLGSSFVRFCIVGLINTAHHYLWFFLLSDFLGPVYSNIMAFVFANIGAYFLNTIFTFKEKPSVRSFLKFPVVSIAQLLINYLVPAAFVYWSIEYVFFVPILSTVICLPLVFLLTKFAIKGSVVSRKNQ